MVSRLANECRYQKPSARIAPIRGIESHSTHWDNDNNRLTG